MERIIQKIIDRFTVPFKDIGKRKLDAVQVNKSKENKRLEELICKEFGFKETILRWEGSNKVNAGTIPHGLLKITDGSAPVLPLKNGDGTYYDSKHAYICAIEFNAGFIDIGITAEEAVACILHEIGHNFVCTPIVNFVSVVEWAFVPINIYQIIKNSTEIFSSFRDLAGFTKNEALKSDQKLMSALSGARFVKIILSAYKIHEYYKELEHSALKLFYNYILPEDTVKKIFEYLDNWLLMNKNTVLAEWEVYANEIKKAKEFFKKNPDYLNYGAAWDIAKDVINFILSGKILFIEKMMQNQSAYSNEVFADSFATAYGYGSATVALHRRLARYELTNKSLAKANTYNVYNQYIFVMANLMYTFLDEHPMSQTRMRKQIDKLKAELNDPNVDPRIRKELMKDLEKSEKIYNDYLNNFPPELKHLAVIMNFTQINEMYFGGKLDPREPINRILNFGNAEA